MMIYLSQSKIDSWSECERQFQLRYVNRNSWPEAPHQAESIKAMALGELFHGLVSQKILMGEKFYLPDLSSNPMLSTWWKNFEDFAPEIEIGNRFRTELKLSSTLSGQLRLTGRIDLLVLSDRVLKIFDWKTGKPRTKGELEQDWQTRIYMALLYASRNTIHNNKISPDDISMTYWYARDPQRSVTLSFDKVWHEKNWQEIIELANRIQNHLDSELNNWPLTTNLATCSQCSFNALCGREPVSNQESLAVEFLEDADSDFLQSNSDFELDFHPDL